MEKSTARAFKALGKNELEQAILRELAKVEPCHDQQTMDAQSAHI